MKAFAFISIALAVASFCACLHELSRFSRLSRQADDAAVTRVTGYLEGQSAVTLQDLARCESADPELLARALAKINAR